MRSERRWLDQRTLRQPSYRLTVLRKCVPLNFRIFHHTVARFFRWYFPPYKTTKTPFPSPFPSLIRFTRWMTKKGELKKNGNGEWKRKRHIYASNRVILPTPHCHSRHDDGSTFGSTRVKKEKVKKERIFGDVQYSESRVGDFSRISYLFSCWPRESPRESKMSTFQKNASDLFLARPRRLLLPCDLFHRFNLSLSLSFSLYSSHSRLYPRSHISLCRAISFARFAPTKSRKLWEGMRGGEGKFFARKPRPDSPLPGPRETGRLRWWCSYTVATFGGGKEKIYISCI